MICVILLLKIFLSKILLVAFVLYMCLQNDSPLCAGPLPVSSALSGKTAHADRQCTQLPELCHCSLHGLMGARASSLLRARTRADAPDVDGVVKAR